ncbi:hypothetical protein OZ401_001914 [Candidatus Chlorohelix allophototropha]|uniref:Uncharacterized protein n=1 Tax=Candidatus Chlorohelix allophototropha TaxID=3003348 RepID=A0ABY9AYY9_9CHLR|nr:hypothetical protein OZ401_001914 [Chloroflexota bacterium L227-S17]
MDFNKFLDGIKLSATKKIEPKSMCAALEKVTDKRGEKWFIANLCGNLLCLLLRSDSQARFIEVIVFVPHCLMLL